MNWRLVLLGLYMPAAIKRRKLKDLFLLTADAFGVAAPCVDGLGYGDCLRRYALFTRQQAERALERESELAEIRDQLYGNARRFGEGIRAQLQIDGPEGAVAAMCLLYRAIGIEMTGGPQRGLPGEIVVRRCFFSQFYSEEVCRLVSALDAGVAAGISGGGQLGFYRRLTGGHDCCRAHFWFEEDAR